MREKQANKTNKTKEIIIFLRRKQKLRNSQRMKRKMKTKNESQNFPTTRILSIQRKRNHRKRREKKNNKENGKTEAKKTEAKVGRTNMIVGSRQKKRQKKKRRQKKVERKTR